VRLLLDTHALIWWLNDSPRLTTTARAAIAAPDNAVFVSVVSGYEIAYKEQIGKLDGELTAILPAALRRGRIRLSHLTIDHTIAAGQLPGPHRDPWDRLIMAQALHGGFTVVTTDRVFRDYGVPVCW
jgi:PIN domain nuclease of toxin-antitoxin system